MMRKGLLISAGMALAAGMSFVSMAEEVAPPQEILLAVDGKEAVVENHTDAGKVSVKGMETVDQKEEETASEDQEDVVAGSWYIIVLSAEKEEHTFETADFSQWENAVLMEERGFWYIQYTDADGKARELPETAEPIELAEDEILTMWALTDVYVREAPKGTAEAVAVAGLGQECNVTALLPGWYQVEYGEVSGYINHKFLTADEAEAQAAKDQEQQARDAAAAGNSYSFGNGGGSSSGSGTNSDNGKDPDECLTGGLLN